MPVENPYLVLEVIGTVAFAISGAAIALRAGMDWLGVVVLAVVTSVGGGTIRDLLLGRVPVAWILDPWPVWLATVVAALVILEGYLHPRRAPDTLRVVLVADAAGLAAFAVASTLIASAAGVSDPVAILLGAVTGTGGGVVRDVLARQRPLVLVGQVYALTALAGGVVLMVLDGLGAAEDLTRWTAMGVVFGLRILAIRYSWSLPHNPVVRASLPGSGVGDASTPEP